ncbi:MAG: tetratricopeptide repeat protein [Actinobacteria bacterium]|nr:tetratricopeptide repeat protein [Actinomycetota bacterium]
MSRGTPFLLKAITAILVLAVVGTGGAIVRHVAFDSKDTTPRTESERALLLAVQAVKVNPNDSRARIKLAAVYLDIGRVNTAVSEARIATKLAPDDAEAFYILGLANKEKGNLTEAARTLEKAAKMEGKLAPFYQTCWSELARIYLKQEKYKQAIKAYDAALGFGPESALLLYEMGLVYEQSGDKGKAMAYFEEALQFVPDYKEAQDALAKVKKEKATAAKPEKPAAK